MMGFISTITGRAGPSGFGSSSTAEQVTMGLDASHITALITGGASGIGAETVRALALRGAHVVIAARNLSAASKAREEIAKCIPTAKIDVMEVDLSSIASVRHLASNYMARNLPLNLLINNAGIMFCPYELSKDGIEKQFATNHLGHFLLTNLLLDTMKKTAKESGTEGRIVNLSSVAHFMTYPGGILFDSLNDKNRYSEHEAYGQSKLANILHAKELSIRLKAEGANITANSVHPGLIWTPLMRHSKHYMKLIQFFSRFLWKNIPQGASTSCFVALHPSLKGISGKYFSDCNEEPTSAFGNDMELSKKLWELSEKLTAA
ncbi:hypothetical protein O6H91_08G046500 [Diphasiastrum complanatum]|uniref:Uncharacterized protein n=1 Tax=Diphasiastrum complanatum TaxID=34168 RepID=A0ACC2CXD3_DIPCM|nr:hypothetical protein O6H91_08G046500 [Diphasiastrum complanatum]